MVIGVLVIASLVELLAIVWASQFLERELRRHSAKAAERHAELIGKVSGLTSTLNGLHRELGGVEDKRNRSRLEDAAAFERFQRELYSRVDALLERGDAAEEVKRLRALLEDSSAVLDQERDSAMSKAMEEGIANIIGYAAGKAPGVELRL